MPAALALAPPPRAAARFDLNGWTRAWKPRLSSGARHLLLELAQQADYKTGQPSKVARWRPTNAKLAAEMGCSEQTVKTRVKELESAGALRRHDGRGNAWAYEFVMPAGGTARREQAPAPAPEPVPALVPEPPPETPPAYPQGDENPAPLGGIKITPQSLFTVAPETDRRSLYPRSTEPPDRRERDKTIGAFARGQLARTRADVPDCRPSAVPAARLCRCCGSAGCVREAPAPGGPPAGELLARLRARLGSAPGRARWRDPAVVAAEQAAESRASRADPQTPARAA